MTTDRLTCAHCEKELSREQRYRRCLACGGFLCRWCENLDEPCDGPLTEEDYVGEIGYR